MQNTFYNNREDNNRFSSRMNGRNSSPIMEDSLAGMVRPTSLTRQFESVEKEDFNNYQNSNELHADEFNLQPNMMVPLNTKNNDYYNESAPINTKANIKQYIFSTIDNVLGGGQQNATRIAQNMNAITNNLSNVELNQYTTLHQYPQQLEYTQSAPCTVRPEKPSITCRLDLFGGNALEDDQLAGLSPKLNKQRKLFDNSNIINNTTMISSNAANMSGENLKAQNLNNLLDTSLFSQIGVNNNEVRPHGNTQQNQQAQIGQANSKTLFQNNDNYLDDEFQIKKMKSYQDAPRGTKMHEMNNFNHSTNNFPDNYDKKNQIMSVNGQEVDVQSKEQSTKKRSRKAYTKKSKKIEEEYQFTNAERDSHTEISGAGNTTFIRSTLDSIKFADGDHENDYYDDSLEANDQTANDMTHQRLTNKKKQYLQDAIQDKNGAYSYLDDPIEYKKARKRLQNRESAVRSRQRKKSYQEELEAAIDDQNEIIDKLTRKNKDLLQKNAGLSSENEVLKQQVSYFQETFANSSLVGSIQQPQIPAPQEMQNVIRQEDLDQFKLEILNKINRRFFEDDTQSRNSVGTDDHTIKHPLQGDDDMLLDRPQTREPLEQLMAEEYADYAKTRKNKRARLNSGCISTANSNESQDVDMENILVLKRDSQNSMHSKGYFFLAVVFGMMCCSSYVQNNSKIQSGDGGFKVPLPKQPQAFGGRDLKSTKSSAPEIEARFGNMNLITSDVSDEYISDDQIQKMYEQKQAREQTVNLRNTAHLMKNLGQMSQEQIMHKMQGAGPLSGLLKSIISGKYTYLTYLMCSTACFFFWMTPNHYKLRHIRPRRSGKSSQSSTTKNTKSDNNNVEMEF